MLQVLVAALAAVRIKKILLFFAFLGAFLLVVSTVVFCLCSLTCVRIHRSSAFKTNKQINSEVHLKLQPEP